MKKALKNLFAKIGNGPDAVAVPDDDEPAIETISREELAAFRGGDKEYKPIYHDAGEPPRSWGKISTFFESL